MKLVLLPLIFFAIYFANCSEFPSKLHESACKIVSEVHKKEVWMKTIAIVKFERNFDEKLIDNLIKCLPMEIAVIQIDMNTFDISSSRGHKVDMVVIIVNDARAMMGQVKMN
jgi:hypothetical protein